MEILDKDIDTIIKNKVILEKLRNIGINTVEELSYHSQKELTEKNIENVYIKDIIIALQCSGLDLRRNKRKR